MADVKDILVELSKSELTRMLEVLGEHLPQQIRAHNYILNYLIHYDELNKSRSAIVSSRWNLRFYRPRHAKPENCTFISITDKKDYCITVFSLEESAQELVECLRLTTRIDWTHQPFALGVDDIHFNPVNDLICTKCNKWTYEPVELIMYIPKERVNKIRDPAIPDEVSVRPLHPSHAKLINERWTHKYDGSFEMIKQSITLNGGVAIIHRETNEVIAWMGTNDFFTPGFLHTIPSQRRKGYGSLVFTYELKRMVKRYNSDLFTFVVGSNNASILLHKQIGFTHVNNIRWIIK